MTIYREDCPCPNRSCKRHGDCYLCELRHSKKRSGPYCQRINEEKKMKNVRKQPVHASSITKLSAAMFLIFLGVMSVILLHYAGYSAEIYICVLFAFVSTASYLFISIFINRIIRKKSLSSSSEASCFKWSRLISGGFAFLVLSTLSIILMSYNEVSPIIYMVCYSAFVLLSLVLVSVGIYKLTVLLNSK